jgi:hypothetical protein
LKETGERTEGIREQVEPGEKNRAGPARLSTLSSKEEERGDDGESKQEDDEVLG